jgi:hypothetical protein
MNMRHEFGPLNLGLSREPHMSERCTWNSFNSFFFASLHLIFLLQETIVVRVD